MYDGILLPRVAGKLHIDIVKGFFNKRAELLNVYRTLVLDDLDIARRISFRISVALNPA